MGWMSTMAPSTRSCRLGSHTRRCCQTTAGTANQQQQGCKHGLGCGRPRITQEIFHSPWRARRRCPAAARSGPAAPRAARCSRTPAKPACRALLKTPPGTLCTPRPCHIIIAVLTYSMYASILPHHDCCNDHSCERGDRARPLLYVLACRCEAPPQDAAVLPQRMAAGGVRLRAMATWLGMMLTHRRTVPSCPPQL